MGSLKARLARLPVTIGYFRGPFVVSAMRKRWVLVIQCSTTVDVGARVMFAHAASVVDGSHRFRDLSRPVNEQGYDVSPIHIGDDAAIMSKLTVIADVGERAFVAAGAVVTEPVPPFSVAAGVPARVIDYFGPPSRTPAT